MVEALARLDRPRLADHFLERHGYTGSVRSLLAGDASFRKYERVLCEGKSYVLMDAPPDKEDVRPFVNVAHFLYGIGLSAPQVLAEDAVNGFLLLEDLGDDLFSRVLAHAPQEEQTLYEAAVDALVALHRHPAPAFVPVYDDALYQRESMLFVEWFLAGYVPDPRKRTTMGHQFTTILTQCLHEAKVRQSVLVLRDYHADNLLWLPERQAERCVGQLDFQDAVLGDPAYDMVSFLEDARRDVHVDTVQRCIARYVAATGMEHAAFMTAYHALGAQRNLKILGIFTRLAVRDGKQHYLNFMPRVWGHLQHDLTHPVLTPLKDWMDANVPAEWRGEAA